MTSKFDPRTATVLEVRRAAAKCLRAGGAFRCPVCRKVARWREGGISSSMARTLLKAYTAGPKERFQCRKIDARDHNGDYAKLRFWGLICEAGPPKGWWRLTPLGRAFVRGEAEVPGKVWTYDKKLVAVFGDPVSIVDCLAKGKETYEAAVERAKIATKRA